MKKTFNFLLGGLICCLSTVHAQSFKSGALNYNLVSANEKTVEVGKNQNFKGETVVIPSQILHQGTHYQVIGIADSAFASTVWPSVTRLKAVQFPENLSYIGKAAFLLCDELDQLNLPQGLKVIDDEAFSGCSETISIVFPEGLEKIGSNAFSGCIIKSFKAPSSLKIIGDYAFYKKNLSHIELNEQLDSIGEMAFSWNTNITSITLPKHLPHLGKGALGVTGVTRLNIPGTWETIPERTFEDCPDLSELTLNEGIRHIETYAFFGCQSLQSLTLPYSVETVGEDAFDMTDLRSITILNPQTTFEKGALRVPYALFSEQMTCRTSNPKVATVDDTGTLHIHGKGETTITVKTVDPESKKTLTATCKVRVGKTSTPDSTHSGGGINPSL